VGSTYLGAMRLDVPRTVRDREPRVSNPSPATKF